MNENKNKKKNIAQQEEQKVEVNETGAVEKSNEIEQLENRIVELEDQLKRAVADYRNLERRTIEQRSEDIRFANKNLIEALLPAFDTLFLAGKYTTDESVKLTIGRILEILKENGIEKVDTDSAKYNAETMEAVEVVGESGEDIIEELRPGFTIYGKLIRPAQVKVGKG